MSGRRFGRLVLTTLFATSIVVGGFGDARAARATPPPDEVGERVARALEHGDGSGFSALVDDHALIDRTLEGFDGNATFVESLRSGLERALSRVGEVMVSNIGSGGRVTYLRTRKVEKTERVLVRVDLGDHGINYLDFYVHRLPDGSWKIYDWLDYVQGQSYTKSLRKVMALMIEGQPTLVSKLFGLSRVDTEVLARIAKLGTLGRDGDWAGWLEVYEELPEEIGNNRVLLTTRIAAANMTGSDEAYLAAMADLCKHYGDDPTLSLALVDYYLLTGDFTRAYAAVDRLDEYTGGDAALSNLRSGIALHHGDNAASIRHARLAISQDPDFESSYWNLLVGGSRGGDYGAAMEAVRALESRFGHTLSEEELAGTEDFSGLVASDEWKAANSGR